MVIDITLAAEHIELALLGNRIKKWVSIFKSMLFTRPYYSFKTSEDSTQDQQLHWILKNCARQPNLPLLRPGWPGSTSFFIRMAKLISILVKKGFQVEFLKSESRNIFDFNQASTEHLPHVTRFQNRILSPSGEVFLQLEDEAIFWNRICSEWNWQFFCTTAVELFLRRCLLNQKLFCRHLLLSLLLF